MRKERDGEREENGLCIFSGSADGDHLMNKIKEYSVKLLYISGKREGRGCQVLRSAIASNPEIDLGFEENIFFSFFSFFEENSSKWRFTISQLVKIFFFPFSLQVQSTINSKTKHRTGVGRRDILTAKDKAKK